MSPEEEGVSSRHLKKFLEELAAGRDLYMQDVMVLRHGKVLCEAAFGGQDLRCPKYTFSACKSVTSLAIGLLVDDGLLSLDEKVVDIFDDIAPQATKRRLKNLSVEHLLTMRSSVVFSEPEALTEEDWPRRFLGSAQKGEPGAEFAYNSLNTYMLSAIIRRKTGRGMTELLQERLFEPMGITDTLWEKCPQGIEKGGWGLYIRPEDMAKLGQLVLNGGQWQGRQLISRAYLDAAVTAHAFPPHTIGDYDYGYQIWVGRHERSFLFNGMLGQNVLGYPDSGILVVTNAGADTDFQESRYFEIVSRYFGGSFPDALPEDPRPGRAGGGGPVPELVQPPGPGPHGGRRALPQPVLHRPGRQGPLHGPAASGPPGPPQQLHRRRGGGVRQRPGRPAGADLPGEGRPPPALRGAGAAPGLGAHLRRLLLSGGRPGPVHPRRGGAAGILYPAGVSGDPLRAGSSSW